MATATWYLNGARAAMERKLDWDTDTIKCLLLASTYVPDIDNHDFLDDVIAHQIIGTGYTAGGKTLTGKAFVHNFTLNMLKMVADNVVWASATITARYAVFYQDTGNSATSPLISYVDFGTDKSVSASDFTVDVSTDGVLVMELV